MKRILCIVFVALVLVSCEGAITVSSDAEVDTDVFEETKITEITSVVESEILPKEQNDKLVAHGGGAIYGFRITNSLEAIDLAYNNGFRYIELDFERTSDGEYVLIHDWKTMAQRMLFEKKVFSMPEFLSADTFMELTLLSLEELVEWLLEHSDVHIITDAKCGNNGFFEELLSAAGEISECFIPQAYSYDEYKKAKELGFSNVILTLYKMENYDETELLSFAEKEKPFAITIPLDKLTKSLVSGLASRDTHTFAHTINSLSDYEYWTELGLYGIYTDYFYPAKFPY